MADNFLERQRDDYEKRRQAMARKKAAMWKKRLKAYAEAQNKKPDATSD